MSVNVTKYETKNGKTRKVKKDKNGTSGGATGSTPGADNKNPKQGA